MLKKWLKNAIHSVFFSCDYDYVIQPLIKDQPAQYAPLKGGEHLFNQTAQTFQYLKEKVARGEIQLENARQALFIWFKPK